jgi:hypothetical protein
MNWLTAAERLAPIIEESPAVARAVFREGAHVLAEVRKSGLGSMGDVASAETQRLIGNLRISERLTALIKGVDGAEQPVASNFLHSASQEYSTNVNLALIRRPVVMRMGGHPTMTHMTFDDTSPLGRAYTANIGNAATVVRLDRTGVSAFTSGSGVTVRSDGMVLGSLHTVSDPGVQGDIFVKLGSHPVPFQGRIVATERPNDLVLIKPFSPLGRTVPFNDPALFASNSIPRGAKIFTVGAPDTMVTPSGGIPHIASTMHMAQGDFIALDEVRHLNGPKVPMYRSTIPEAFQGMSGGGTYTEGSGHYIGALQSRHDPSRDLSGLRGSRNDWTALTPGYISRNFVIANYHR